MRSLPVVILGLMLAGCGAISQVQRLDAGMTYRQSAAKYKECLQAAPNPQACARERAIMEADERTFTTTNAGYTGGAVNTTITNR